MADNATATQTDDLVMELSIRPNISPQTKELEFSFTQVSYNVKSDTKSTKQILSDTCGTFHAGRLTAILGPSGAGKSTLLNVLAGFKVKDVSGRFELNGEPRDLLNFRKICSYIPQNFTMLALLTVQETLRVSADLKLPRTTSKQEKLEIIDHIVDILNLTSCRHTLVGHISGGEQKRLSIGIELVTNPPIMLFDEPTSGLDSVASYQVMCYLQQLARDGRIVVCVVHQPSSRLMQLFEDVVVVSQGQILYADAQCDMLDRFEKAGFHCPPYYNPADFMLDTASAPSEPRLEVLIAENKARHGQAKSFDKNVEDEQVTLLSAHNKIPSEMSELTQVRPKEQVGFWFQLQVLLCRHLRTMSRHMMAVRMRVVMHVVIALLLGVVYYQIGNDASKVISNVSCLFFIILFIFAGNAMPSILLYVNDSPVFIREYYNGWYSLTAYYLSKILGDLPMQLVCPTLFLSISYYMTGQPSEWFRYVVCLVICLEAAFIGHLIGAIGGSLFELEMAAFLVPCISIPFLLFSGFFIRLSELSWFLRPICDISYFRYIFEGLMRAVYGYDRGTLPCNAEFCYFKSTHKFLKDFDMLGDNVGWDLGALFLFSTLLLLAFYLALHINIRRAL